MRQRILLYFLFLSYKLFAQIPLTDVSFEFKKSSDYHQLITNVNPKTLEIVTFATDKEKLFVAKFNSFVFFSDSLTVPKPDGLRYMMGCGFTENNNPISYWATEKLDKFIGIEFDFASHTTKTFEYTINLTDYNVFTDFTDNGILYFLCEKEDSKMVQLFIFDGHNVIHKELDFSKCTILNKNVKNISFIKALNEYGLTKIETKGFNSFVTASNPIKYYVKNNTLIITLDINPIKTQIFEVDLGSFKIKESTFPQEQATKEPKQSNSLLINDYLFQLKFYDDALEIQIVDYINKKSVKSFLINEKNPSPFSNSVFYNQVNNTQPTELKNTKKFIRKLLNSNLGISIYPFKGNYIATFGSSKNIRSNSDFFYDFASIASGYDLEDFIGSGNQVFKTPFLMCFLMLILKKQLH
ncbi:MAG: hypothetical protein HC854_15230 [Flavobacterium sp.]|nr:hypothetical protein [Flavobacterium sp.]